tara:strand:+ start:70 stop:1188 length:1119 start_codon:yes stop_codon:yes gene_type:complete
MDPILFDLNEKDDTLKFTISNINVSLANAIRRVIISDIPCVVFETLPHEKNNSTFYVNTSKFNNEILKQRLACIPIHFNNLEIPINEFIDNFMLEVDVKNNSDSIIYVTTADFKIKHLKTDKYLQDDILKQIFPPNPITNQYIDFCRLLPKLSDTIPGQHLKFSCKFSISTAKENGSYNIVSCCAYKNTPDYVKIEEEAKIFMDQLKEKYEDEQTINLEFNDWKTLDAKRIFQEDSFDFTIKTIGIYTNKEILKKSINIIINRLNNLKEIFTKNTQYISNSNTTIPNSYNIILENEDFTIGKIIEIILYNNYYNGDFTLTYCGFDKPHPHLNISIIRIAFKNEQPIDSAQRYIVESSQFAIDIYEKFLKQIV